MKKTALLFSVCILFFSSCKSDPVTPPPDNPPAGSRNYEWTVDTLFIPEGSGNTVSIWANNIGDIWAVGPSYLNNYCIWRYDGIKWTNFPVDKYIDPFGVIGFGSNDVWIGSVDGSFWHYNGKNLSKTQQTNIPGYANFVVQNLASSSSKNIFAVGFAMSSDGENYKAVIMHYGGEKWTQISIPEIHLSFSQIINIKNSSQFLIKAWDFNSPETKIYLFDGANLTEIFSTSSGFDLFGMGDNIYAVDGTKIYKYHDKQFTLFKNFSGTNFAGAIRGRNENDFFSIAYDGIAHYNGSDLVTVFTKWNENLFPGTGIVLGKDVFFVWTDSHITTIVHGHLKEE